MKKLFSFILALSMVVSFMPLIKADDGFKVKVQITAEETNKLIKKLYVPEFSGFESASILNNEINSLINSNIDSVIKMLEDGEFNLPYYIGSSFEYSKYRDLLSVWINIETYTGGAHGFAFKVAYTINTKTGEFYKLSDLLKSGKTLEQKVLEKVNDSSEYYFESSVDYIKSLNGDYRFYLEGNKIVIFFDLYEIAAYAFGMPNFKFDVTDVSDTINDNILDEIKDSYFSKISFNGQAINTDKESYTTEDYVIMVPLRVIAEALSYEVGYDENFGASVAGGYVKAGVNLYFKNGEQPLELEKAPVITNGTTYVPLSYFTKILNEHVIGWDNIKIYK